MKTRQKKTSSRPSTGSATGTKRKGLTLRAQLFIAILAVALICIATTALLSNILGHQQVNDFVRRYRERMTASSPAPTTINPRDPYRSLKDLLQDNPLNPMNPFIRPTLPPPPRGPSNWNLVFILAGLLGLFLAFVLSFVLAGRISSPLSRLTLASTSIADGDYSERVHVGGGKEVEELGDAFNTLAESLETNEQLRKNMVADIAHELRNPLATLSGQIELMQDGKLESSDEVVASLAEDAELLSHLVEDLRQLSVAEAGQLELDRTPVNPGEIVEDASSRFENEALSKGIKLVTDVPGDLPAVNADKLRISQVIGNLIRNSLTHTPSGGTIKVSATRAGNVVTFAVEDTGAGVDEKDLPYLFERFYRADSSRTRATGGAGLGLSIAKSLVKAHGGQIGAESQPGKGCRIFFTLPVAGSED
jgi:signal transduction histidine kinase